jgi:hypothetical protein
MYQISFARKNVTGYSITGVDFLYKNEGGKVERSGEQSLHFSNIVTFNKCARTW